MSAIVHMNCAGGDCPGCIIENCEIGSDDFTADNLAADWTTTGTWAVGSGVLTCTSPGLAIFDTSHPDGDPTMVVEATFQHNTSGRTCDLLVAVVDSSNYYRARYTIGTNNVRIQRVAGGVATDQSAIISATLATNTTYTGKACVDADGVITAYLNGTPIVSSVLLTPTGTKGGLGASGTGTATFDNFVLSKGHSPDATTCEQCNPPGVPCSNCDPSDETPMQLVVTVAFTNNVCTDCEPYLSGSFTLDRLPTSGFCEWCYGAATARCAGPTFYDLNAKLILSAGNYILNVFLIARSGDPCNGGVDAGWTKDFGTTKPSCADWSGLVLDDAGYTWPGSRCLIPATITVDAA